MRVRQSVKTVRDQVGSARATASATADISPRITTASPSTWTANGEQLPAAVRPDFLLRETLMWIRGEHFPVRVVRGAGIQV
eukprot:2651456-Rhodomonas_salina.1